MLDRFIRIVFSLLLLTAVCVTWGAAQVATSDKAALGSSTAKNGFKNENEIRDKFNNWRIDKDAQEWLAAMNYRIAEVDNVVAAKPHGQKSDVEVRVTTKSGERKEGISIKLVSSPNGFNQIDKRWLATYAKMWKMPPELHTSLKLFVGETPPRPTGRDKKRMYLTELTPAEQAAVLDFFSSKRDEIISDLFSGDGAHAADWIMVAFKSTANTRWIIRSLADAIKHFADGKVEITRAGNLKIGRITMQRKGGDGGRETAKMLQFKINPVHLFDAK